MAVLGYSVAETQEEDGFAPVDTRFLEEEATLACDLYRRIPGRGYALFLSGQCPLAPELWASLRRSHIRRLYVKREDTVAFVPYVLARLQVALSKLETPVADRAGVALESVTFLIENLMGRPQPEMMGALKDVVGATLDLAVQDAGALHILMQHTRDERYAPNHSLNVGIWGTALALMVHRRGAGDRTQEADDWLVSVGHGLFLHDIGKVLVPAEVLYYPGKYRPQHWAIMRQHPEFGIRVLQETGLADPIVHSIVLQHHERNDGSGYPRGLRSERISFEAKICTVVDVFDALTSKRPYREPCQTYDALRTMIDEMRQEFDPLLFETFIRLFEGATWYEPRAEAGEAPSIMEIWEQGAAGPESPPPG